MKNEKEMKVKELNGYDKLPFADPDDIIDIIETYNMSEMLVRDIIQIAIYRELRAIRIELECEE